MEARTGGLDDSQSSITINDGADGVKKPTKRTKKATSRARDKIRLETGSISSSRKFGVEQGPIQRPCCCELRRNKPTLSAERYYFYTRSVLSD